MGIPTPQELLREDGDTPFCNARFGNGYLRNLAASRTAYCTPDSGSQLECFHSQMPQAQKPHSFCIGAPADYTAPNSFFLDCYLREIDLKDQERGAIQLSQFLTYWYETGPKVLFKKYVKLSDAHPDGKRLKTSSQRVFILISREGAGNLWHTLMKIFSMTMTLDTLRVAMG